MTNKLSEVALIQFGPYLQSKDSGRIKYLQVRQFNDLGEPEYPADEFILNEDEAGNNLLNDGDVLLVSKGNRLFAWRYRLNFGPAIASSIFFVLKPHKDLIDPDFLAAVLNYSQTKKALQVLGGGSNIFSIRKSELADFKIPVLSISKQKALAKLSGLHSDEINIVQKLMREKQNLFTGYVSKILND